jgi:DNA polymerase III subunit gamma/tau
MSDNYIVSARKYRPQTFDTVVGQEHITTTLKNAIKNQHLAHAYLFCGPRGVGKTTCARILAKTINCEHPTADMEACGTCATCTSLRDSISFNVFELDAASNNSVEDIRELTSQVRFAPQQGKYKVYIIDEVHMLSASAFNAFLKTLEEPPPYAIFILATTEKHKILPTILSRCQIFDFKRITTSDTVAHLQSIATKERMIANEAALHVIAQKSEGCMRDALSMLDRIASFTNGMLTYANTMEHLNLLDADFYFRLTDSMLSQDVAGTLLLLDKALEKGFEGDVIAGGLAEHFRNLMLCKDGRMAKLLDVPGEHKQMYHEKANQMPPSYIISALNVINESELHYKSATNKRLHVELCLIRLCFLLQFTSPQSIPDSATTDTVAVPGEKKNPDTITPPPQMSSAVEVNQHIAPASSPEPQTQAPQPIEPTRQTLQEPAPAPAYVAPVKTEAAPATTTAKAPPTRKVSLGVFDDLDEAMDKASQQKASAPKALTPEKAADIFEQYKQDLLATEKSVLYAQFSMMKIQLIDGDEVRIIAPTELTETYAKEQRSSLIEFYAGKAEMNVRITTEIQFDESLEPETRALSKSEIYEAMVAKNPNLAKLKDGAGLHLEY